MMKRKMDMTNITSKDMLLNRATAAWDTMLDEEIDYFTTLSTSMPARCVRVIENNGFPTKY